jgi:hypothetical protein
VPENKTTLSYHELPEITPPYDFFHQMSILNKMSKLRRAGWQVKWYGCCQSAQASATLFSTITDRLLDGGDAAKVRFNKLLIITHRLF